jgi:hypothetical protein
MAAQPHHLSTQRPWWLLPTGRVHAMWCIAAAGVLIGVDYFTGPHPQAPFLYFFPVALTAWYSGRAPALFLAVLMPLSHLFFVRTVASQLGGTEIFVIQSIVRAVLIAFLAVWIARLAEYERALDTRVKQLEGLLSICSFCKKIRNDTGEWEMLERFISTHSHAQFSHGLCPSCGKEQYGGLFGEVEA